MTARKQRSIRIVGQSEDNLAVGQRELEEFHSNVGMENSTSEGLRRARNDCSGEAMVDNKHRR